MGCCSALAGLFYGRIAMRMHQMQVLFLGFLAMGAGLCLLGIAGSVAVIAFAAVFVGFGNGVIIPAGYQLDRERSAGAGHGKSNRMFFCGTEPRAVWIIPCGDTGSRGCRDLQQPLLRSRGCLRF